MKPPLPTPPPQLRPRADPTVLPLTTIFTPPQSCLDAPFTLDGSSSGVVGFSSAWRDYSELSSHCYPYSFSALQYDFSWYSPGVCASGYDVAQTSMVSGSASVTQAWCCPSGYTITGWLGTNGLNYQACTSLASNTPVISTSGNFTTTITMPSFSFYATQWPISVEWASSDLSLFTPASAPSIAAEATSTITSATGKANPSGARRTGGTPSATTTANDTGLSTGATAGVAVGVVVAVLAILAGILFWWFKRRRSRQRIPDEAHKSSRPFYVDQKVELPVEEPRRKDLNRPMELDAMNLQEMDVPERAKERPSINREPAELEGDWHGNERPG